MRWGYFRKKTTDGPFELFSDIESRIKHLNGIIALLGIVAAVDSYIGIYNLWVGIAAASPFNIFSASTILALVALLIFGIVKLCIKKASLKEQQIFE